MPTKPLFFISHIHEESELAVLIQQAIKSEFSGFVDVFVSSDGDSIDAGGHFLESIEDALVNCVGAIYLISPTAMTRPWVNFELGAVWCRGATSKAAGGHRLPALPLCHSGARPSRLPAPLNMLNGVTGHDAADLRLAFRALQKALQVDAPLRTDFEDLAAKVLDFENRYTIGEVLRERIRASLPPENIPSLIDTCKQSIASGIPAVIIKLENLKPEEREKWNQCVAGPLAGIVRLEFQKGGVAYGPEGPYDFSSLLVQIEPRLVVKHADTILKR